MELPYGFVKPDWTIETLLKEHVSMVYRTNNNHVVSTAYELGISRATMYRFIDRFGLEIPKSYNGRRKIGK